MRRSWCLRPGPLLERVEWWVLLLSKDLDYEYPTHYQCFIVHQSPRSEFPTIAGNKWSGLRPSRRGERYFPPLRSPEGRQEERFVETYSSRLFPVHDLRRLILGPRGGRGDGGWERCQKEGRGEVHRDGVIIDPKDYNGVEDSGF